MPGLEAETLLNREQRDALDDDLRSTEDIAAAAPAVGAAAQRVVEIHQADRDNIGRPPR
jgi:hypothetical protein